MAKCPYDPTHENTAKPQRSGHKFFATCPVCKRKSLVTIRTKVDGTQAYSLSRIGKYSLGEFAKKVRSFRASDSEMAAIERGDMRLVVCNNRITLSV